MELWRHRACPPCPASIPSSPTAPPSTPSTSAAAAGHPADRVRSAAFGYLRKDSRNGDVGFRFLVEQAVRPEPPRDPPGAAGAGGTRRQIAPPVRVGRRDRRGRVRHLGGPAHRAVTQRLRWIEAGSFLTGSPPNEAGHAKEEEQRR